MAIPTGTGDSGVATAIGSAPPAVRAGSASLATTTPLPPTKIRGFVVDEKTSRPLKGVVVLALLEFAPAGSSAGGLSIPLGMLASDAAGYVSFDLKNSLGHASDLRSAHLWVYPLRAEQSKQDVLTQMVAGFQFLLEVDASLSSSSYGGLPAVQNPDHMDWQISPHSFSTKVDLVLGEDDCQVPVPSTVAERELGFSRVVRRTPLVEPNSSPATGLVNVMNPITIGAPVLEYGDLLEFRQQWFPIAHCLGQVIYSLPLAPCESVNLAVIDWSRQDTAVRQDTVVETESLLHDQRRDRSIEETVASALHESQGGWSVLGGNAGAMSGSNQGMNFGAAHSLGGGISQTWGNRDVTGNSLQEIHDHVTQATSVVRTLNSTVIVQATQKESSVVQTRTVTNHNHCHALTMQYFEVLRNFRVVTEFVRKRPVVLIPYRPVSFGVTATDWSVALRFRTILEQALLDASLAGCFDAMVRLHLCPDVYPKNMPTVPAPSPSAQAPVHLGTWNVATRLVSTGQTISKGDTLQFISSGQVTFGGDVLHTLVYDADGRNEIADDQHGYFAPGLKEYSLVFKIGPSPWIQGGADLTYVSKDYEGLLVMIPNGDARISGDTGNWSVDVYDTPAGSGTGGGTTTPPHAPNKADDECCEARLLTHLASNVGYYNRAIWVLQDPVERRLLVEASLGQQLAVKFGFDDTPVAVSGNYVAFPYNDPNPGDAPPPHPPQVSIMSLPTRGVFLEAQLSHCNACETRDVTRLWQWDESPCATPPTIQGITPGPKGQPETVQPATLPAAVVQISQPLSEPNPLGLAAAFDLLGKANLFRDMSGMQEVSKLVDQLATGAVSLVQAQDLAKAAKQKLTSASGGGNSTRSAPSESDPGRQIDKLNAVKYAQNAGLVSSSQASDASAGILGGTPIACADGGLPTGVVGTGSLTVITDVVSFTTRDSTLRGGGSGPPALAFTATMLKADGGTSTDPALTWQVEGIGPWSPGGTAGVSGKVQFSFTPDANAAAFGLGHGSRQDAMGYIVIARSKADAGIVKDAVQVKQDEIDQLRQEYIDYALAVPVRGSFAPAPGDDTNFMAGNINDTLKAPPGGGQYAIVLNGTTMRVVGQAIGGHYDALVRAATGAAGPYHVRVKSGYRNPYRNEQVGGCFAAGIPVPVCLGPSSHMTGHGLDLVPGEVVPGQAHSELMVMVNDAVSAAGYTPLPEIGNHPARHPDGTPAPELANHIHVQF